MSDLIPGHRLVLDPDAWQILSARRTLFYESMPMTIRGSFYPVEIAGPPRAELDAELRLLKPGIKLSSHPLGALFMVEGIVYRAVHVDTEISVHDSFLHLHIHARSIWFDPDHFSTAPSDNSQPKTLQALPEKLLASSSISVAHAKPNSSRIRHGSLLRRFHW